MDSVLGEKKKSSIGEELVNIEEEPFDEYGNTITGNELMQLNQKHS